jgi:hypothetical protein
MIETLIFPRPGMGSFSPPESRGELKNRYKNFCTFMRTLLFQGYAVDAEYSPPP